MVRIVLQVLSETSLVRKAWIKENQTLQVGTIDWADLVITDDPLMADLHFALESDDDQCHVRNLATSGQTLVNGDHRPKRPLADGDEIRAGNTLFRVSVIQQASQTTTVPKSTVPVPEDATTRIDPIDDGAQSHLTKGGILAGVCYSAHDCDSGLVQYQGAKSDGSPSGELDTSAAVAAHAGSGSPALRRSRPMRVLSRNTGFRTRH